VDWELSAIDEVLIFKLCILCLPNLSTVANRLAGNGLRLAAGGEFIVPSARTVSRK